MLLDERDRLQDDKYSIGSWTRMIDCRTRKIGCRTSRIGWRMSR